MREARPGAGARAGVRGRGGPLTATLRTLHIEGAKGGQVRMAMG